MIDFIDRAQEVVQEYESRSAAVSELVLRIIKTTNWQKRAPASGKLKVKEFEYFYQFVEAVRPWGLQMRFKKLEEICKGYTVYGNESFTELEMYSLLDTAWKKDMVVFLNDNELLSSIAKRKK